MTVLLETERLVAGYGGVPVLHDVDLALEEGTITAVLGANGAGKTTLLRTVSRLQRTLRGDVRYRGRSLGAVPVEDLVGLGIAHVPEGRGVITELTVADNLRLGGLWRTGRTAAAETQSAVAEVYELFPPLADRRKHLGHQLSGGERQMLALGRALVARPTVLLLDEPSLGLAPVVTARIMALLRDLRDRTGLTVLLVEQNGRSALQIADHGVVLALGRVVAVGTPVDLLADDQLRHNYLGF
jgi:branched-chain amino acid transport system ATP-binding protein